MGEYDSKHYFPTFCKILEKLMERFFRKLRKTVKKAIFGQKWPFLPLLTKFQAKKKMGNFYFLFFIHVILHKFKKQKKFWNFFCFVFLCEKWPKMLNWDLFSGEYEFLEKRGHVMLFPLWKLNFMQNFRKIDGTVFEKKRYGRMHARTDARMDGTDSICPSVYNRGPINQTF